MWQEGTPSSGVQIGKRQRGVQDGPRTSPKTIGPPHTVSSVVVAAVKSSAAVVLGRLGGKVVEMMLDSGSSVSLVQQDVLQGVDGIVEIPPQEMRLVTAAGDHIPVLKHLSIPVHLDKFTGLQPFLVVPNLITPVILGLDFLQTHQLTIDFTSSPVAITPHSGANLDRPTVLSSQPFINSRQQDNARVCAVMTDTELLIMLWMSVLFQCSA